MGGAPTYIWPGGGITLLVDVTRLPENAFGYVPTPAIVAPIEFTVSTADYERLGGHLGAAVKLEEIIGLSGGAVDIRAWQGENPWPWQPLTRN